MGWHVGVVRLHARRGMTATTSCPAKASNEKHTGTYLPMDNTYLIAFRVSYDVNISKTQNIEQGDCEDGVPKEDSLVPVPGEKEKTRRSTAKDSLEIP